MRKISSLGVAALCRKPGVHRIDQGLYVRVRGGAFWVFRYSVAGRAHELGLGPVSAVTLAEARAKALDLRRDLIAGRDPLAERRREKSATFAEVAADLIAAKAHGWSNEKHAWQWTRSLEMFAYPALGRLDVARITTAHVLLALKPIWTTKHETAIRVRQRIEAVLDAATARGLRAGDNPARWKGHLDKILTAVPKAERVTHHPALPWRDIPAFMSDLRSRDAIAARTLEFAILTAARTGEVLGAKWSEVDGLVWTVPSSRMKAKREHRVPLSDRAAALLRDLPRESEWVFPGRAGKPLSNMSLLMLLRRMGRGDIVAHGFRSTFRDWAAETTNFQSEVVEMALAHAIGNAVEAAYRRGDLIERRRELMGAWAKYCGGINTVVTIMRAKEAQQ